MGHLLYLHMTTGKNIALTIWSFIGKLMCCLGMDSGYQKLGELLLMGSEFQFEVKNSGYGKCCHTTM